LQVLQVLLDQVAIVREVAHEVQFAVEEEQSSLVVFIAENRIEHGGNTTHSGKLTPCPATALDRDHQRDGRGFCGFVQVDRLSDAIVLDDEILCVQTVDDITLVVSNHRGYEHQIGLRTESRLLLCRGRPEDQHEHQNMQARSEDVHGIKGQRSIT